MASISGRTALIEKSLAGQTDAQPSGECVPAQSWSLWRLTLSWALTIIPPPRTISSAVEHRLHTAGVGGSNPSSSTSIKRTALGIARFRGFVFFPTRSEERRVGKECVITGISWWLTVHYKRNNT